MASVPVDRPYSPSDPLDVDDWSWTWNSWKTPDCINFTSLESNVEENHATSSHVDKDNSHIPSTPVSTEEEDDDEPLFYVNPRSSFLHNLKFIKFLSGWNSSLEFARDKELEQLVKTRRDRQVVNPNDDVDDCDDDRKPYSPGCEIKSLNDHNDNDQTYLTVAKKVMSSRKSSKTLRHGQNDLRNSEAYTPSYDKSDNETETAEGMTPDSDALPSSAAEMKRTRGRLTKLQRLERISEEVKIVLDPYFKNKVIDKTEYKHVMKGAVQKIYRAKNKPIVPSNIEHFLKNYVRRIRLRRKIRIQDSSDVLQIP